MKFNTKPQSCLCGQNTEKSRSPAHRIAKNHHVTQEQFSERTGISYKYYQAIETGVKKELRISTLERLANAYGITGMNPDLLADGRADFRFDAFNEAHANPAKFIGWPDRGGNFQRGLFYLSRSPNRRPKR